MLVSLNQTLSTCSIIISSLLFTDQCTNIPFIVFISPAGINSVTIDIDPDVYADADAVPDVVDIVVRAIPDDPNNYDDDTSPVDTLIIFLVVFCCCYYYCSINLYFYCYICSFYWCCKGFRYYFLVNICPIKRLI